VSISVKFLKAFDNCQQCKNYLRQGTNEKQNKIIFIISNRLDQQIIEHIHHLKQIISVFVFFRMNREKNELLTKKMQKGFPYNIHMDFYFIFH